MGKANRKYITLKTLFEKGEIKSFDQFVEWIPYTTLAKEIKMGPGRMKRLLYKDIGEITLKETIKISKALDIDLELLEDLATGKIEEKGNRNSGK